MAPLSRPTGIARLLIVVLIWLALLAVCLTAAAPIALDMHHGNVFYLALSRHFPDVATGVGLWVADTSVDPLRFSLVHAFGWLAWMALGDYILVWVTLSMVTGIALLAVAVLWTRELTARRDVLLATAFGALVLAGAGAAFLSSLNAPRALAFMVAAVLVWWALFRIRLTPARIAALGLAVAFMLATSVFVFAQFLTVVPVVCGLYLLRSRPLWVRGVAVAGYFTMATVALCLLSIVWDANLHTDTYYAEASFWLQSVDGLYDVVKWWPHDMAFLRKAAHGVDTYKGTLLAFSLLGLIAWRRPERLAPYRRGLAIAWALFWGAGAYVIAVYMTPFGAGLGTLFTYGVVAETSNAQAAVPLELAGASGWTLVIALAMDVAGAQRSRVRVWIPMVVVAAVCAGLALKAQELGRIQDADDRIDARLSALASLNLAEGEQCTVISDPFTSLLVPLGTPCTAPLGNINFLTTTPLSVIEPCNDLYNGRKADKECTGPRPLYVVYDKGFQPPAPPDQAAIFSFKYRFNPDRPAFQSGQLGALPVVKHKENDTYIAYEVR